MVLLINRHGHDGTPTLPLPKQATVAQLAPMTAEGRGAAVARGAWPKGKLAVIGPNANQKDNTLGDYNPNAAQSESAWAAASNDTVVTVYAGLAEHVRRSGLEVDVQLAHGCAIQPGAPSPQDLAEAVALHRAACGRAAPTVPQSVWAAALDLLARLHVPRARTGVCRTCG